MKQLTMFVTSEGRWVLGDSDEFLSVLGDLDPDYDSAMFAVKNLGFIKFQMFEDSIVEIELHPRNTELVAVRAVEQQLFSTNVKLFRLKFFDTSWKSEIYSSSAVAASRLAELCARNWAPEPEDKFQVEPQDFVGLIEAEESPLRLMAQKWRISFGYFDPSVISFAINHGLLSRLMIAGIKPARPDPIFRFIGDGHANWLDHEYRFQAIGEKLENFPDKDYGGWLSQFYKHVAKTGEPRYDYVTAVIWQPPDTYLTRYERLLLPWKTPSDEILVTLSSKGVGTASNSRSSSELSSSEPESPVERKLARSA